MNPPPLIPWNGFDLSQDNAYCRATRRIAELLADDEWHRRDWVVNEIMSAELELTKKTVETLISKLKSHGDIREHRHQLRLTTRWRADG